MSKFAGAICIELQGGAVKVPFFSAGGERLKYHHGSDHLVAIGALSCPISYIEKGYSPELQKDRPKGKPDEISRRKGRMVYQRMQHSSLTCEDLALAELL